MSLLKLPLGPLERALLESLQRLEPGASEGVLAAAALCCQVLNNGDVCLLLARWAGQRPWGEGYALPPLAQWRAELSGSTLVGAPGEFAPLILEGERLYLARYQPTRRSWRRNYLVRAADLPAVDEVQLSDSLARLFASNVQQPDWQRLAAAQAVRKRLAVISGGPGTGKTTTVVRLLAALLEQPGWRALGDWPGGADRQGGCANGRGDSPGQGQPAGQR